MIKTEKIGLVLDKLNVKFNEQELWKLISEIDPEYTGYTSYAIFKPVVVPWIVDKIMGVDEEEVLDAYVAMGGEADGSGHIES